MKLDDLIALDKAAKETLRKADYACAHNVRQIIYDGHNVGQIWYDNDTHSISYRVNSPRDEEPEISGRVPPQYIYSFAAALDRLLNDSKEGIA